MKRLGKILGYVLTSIMVLTIALAAVLIFSSRFSTERLPTINGWRMLTVLSGSMSPTINTGDAIIIRPLELNEVPKEGDVITFRSSQQETESEVLITHRVMGVISINGQPAAWATKGDANNSPDTSTVSRDRIIGVYSWRIPYFGYVAHFLRQPMGIVVMLVIPGLFLIAGEVRKIYRVLEEAEKAKASQSHSESAAK